MLSIGIVQIYSNRYRPFVHDLQWKNSAHLDSGVDRPGQYITTEYCLCIQSVCASLNHIVLYIARELKEPT